MAFVISWNRLFTLLVLLSIATTVFGCHMSKRKRRQVGGVNDIRSQNYISACLQVEAHFRDFNWRSNIQYTFDDTNWYLGTRDVLCGLKSGYDNAKCWKEEVEEYVGDNQLLPIVKRCIEKLFSDTARGEYTYASRKKRQIRSPKRYSGLGRVNSAYVNCVQRGSSLDLAKLIPVIASTTVVRKDDSRISSRPITYAQKLLFLTRPDSRLRRAIQACNQHHFPARYTYLYDCTLSSANFWTEWSPWSHCLPSCNGKRTKTRTCRDGDAPTVVLPESQCDGKAKKILRCYDRGCWSAWGNWGGCSKNCKWGIRVRSRTCQSSFQGFGRPFGFGFDFDYGQPICYGKTTERGSCNIHTECQNPPEYNY